MFVYRGIVKEMGLTGKITPDQVAKKWDNLKTKFKVTTFISLICSVTVNLQAALQHAQAYWACLH